LDFDGRALSQYMALFHGKRLLTGYSGFIGAWGDYTTARLASFPGRGALSLLRELGVRWVVVHAATDQAAAGFAPFSRLAGEITIAGQYGRDLVVEVNPSRATPALPPAGPMPRGEWRVHTSPEGGGIAV